MDNDFTAEAKVIWDSIPKQARERILSNVWCPHCSSATTITGLAGRVEAGDLILAGHCAVCGNAVARVIEGG